MQTRRTNLANQYVELQRLRRELYLMEEKLGGSKIEAEGTEAAYDGQAVRGQNRGDRPHENTRRSTIQRWWKISFYGARRDRYDACQVAGLNCPLRMSVYGCCDALAGRILKSGFNPLRRFHGRAKYHPPQGKIDLQGLRHALSPFCRRQAALEWEVVSGLCLKESNASKHFSFVWLIPK
jgi:hypothetical protein